MCALIQAVVWVQMNIKRLVLQASCWKGPYAFCSKLESDHERLASPLSLTTAVLTHKMPLPLLFFLWLVDSSVSPLSRANMPGCSLSWSTGSRWSLGWFCFGCNSAFFFFSFLALSLSRWPGQCLLPSAGGCAHSWQFGGVVAGSDMVKLVGKCVESHKGQTGPTLTKIVLGFMHPLFHFLCTERIFHSAFSSCTMHSNAIWWQNLATHQGHFRQITGHQRLRFQQVSPFLHHFYTSCTQQSTSINGGCQCSPKETLSMPQKRCVLSLIKCID